MTALCLAAGAERAGAGKASGPAGGAQVHGAQRGAGGKPQGSAPPQEVTTHARGKEFGLPCTWSRCRLAVGCGLHLSAPCSSPAVCASAEACMCLLDRWPLWQAVALRQAAAQPQTEVCVVERAVEVPDGARIHRLEAQLADAEQEHADLQRCGLSGTHLEKVLSMFAAWPGPLQSSLTACNQPFLRSMRSTPTVHARLLPVALQGE